LADVFDVLVQDHQVVKQMLSELEAGAVRPGTSPDQLAQRKKLAEQLIIEESRHEAVEEMYFWPAVRERLRHGGELADTAILQEQQGKEVLAKLDKLDATDPQFEALLAEFISAGREHIEYEEAHVWPELRSVLSRDAAAELGRKITEAKKTAPTRPTRTHHPPRARSKPPVPSPPPPTRLATR